MLTTVENKQIGADHKNEPAGFLCKIDRVKQAKKGQENERDSQPADTADGAPAWCASGQK